MWPFEFCKHVRDRSGVMESSAGVSGRSALDHFEFTDVRFGMRVPNTEYCILILVVYAFSFTDFEFTFRLSLIKLRCLLAVELMLSMFIPFKI